MFFPFFLRSKYVFKELALVAELLILNTHRQREKQPFAFSGAWRPLTCLIEKLSRLPRLVPYGLCPHTE